MNRVCGHIHNPDAVRTWQPLAALIGSEKVAAGPAATVVDRSDLVSHIEDQGQTGSCVWQARARAIDLVARAAVAPIEWRSVQFGYAVTRMLARGSVDVPLTDEGCSPELAAIVAATWGMPPASALPFNADHINDEPSVVNLIKAADHTLGGEYVIDGTDRAQLIAAAIDAGHFPTLAVVVDEGFDRTDGQMPIGEPFGNVRGRHDICAIGYLSAGGVVSAIKIVNSWGSAWGQGGFAWLAAERVNHESTVSVQCFTSKPR